MRTGDVITAHYNNGNVLYAEVTQLAGGSSSTQPTVSLQSGSVVSVANNVLILISGNQAITLTLNPNAFVYRSGASVSASGMQAGDVITARSYNNYVIYAEVTQLSNDYNQNFAVSGTYNSITLDNQGKISAISINQTNPNGSTQSAVYSVSSSVTINGSMVNLVPNRPIILQGTGELVTAIIIQ